MVGILLLWKLTKTMYILVSYDATDRVFDIVKAVKQQIIYYLWQKYSDFLSEQY